MQTPEESASASAASTSQAGAPAVGASATEKTAKSAKDNIAETGTAHRSSASENHGKSDTTPKSGKNSDLDSGSSADAIDLLKADHRQVEALFSEFESASDRRKAAIIREACTALTLHTILEEEIFYPACRAADGEETEDALDEAQVEHDCAKLLIIELLASRDEDPLQDARFKVLAEQIKHHVAEEEAPRTGVFAKAKAAGVDTAALGRRLQERKRRLLKEADRLRPSRLVSFHQLQGEDRPNKEYGMPRHQGPERDERGRFMSDDDGDRRGGSYSRSHDDDRGRDDRGGRGHGGWFGDSEGHSMAARSRGEGRSFRDEDNDGGDGRGWYGDSRGHALAARRGWDERRSARGDDDRDRDDRGRFMSDDDRSDSGGRGRGSASFDRERDDQGRFMSDDDRGYGRRSSGSYDRDRDDRGRFMSDDEGSDRSGGRGRRSASFDRDRDDQGRFMSDDDRSSYRGRDDDDGDGRGWYGDSRGHAAAARRGWEGRSRTSRDDDDRSGRSDRGHGGWFGDSRGHAEASRRGWEHRR